MDRHSRTHVITTLPAALLDACLFRNAMSVTINQTQDATAGEWEITERKNLDDRWDMK